jgi:hypothetical protein
MVPGSSLSGPVHGSRVLLLRRAVLAPTATTYYDVALHEAVAAPSSFVLLCSAAAAAHSTASFSFCPFHVRR